jgi:hypothetical protein
MAKEIYPFEQPITGVPVLKVNNAYFALDLTGAVWTRTESTSNDTTTVTVTCEFPQGAIYTQVGTLTDSDGTQTYTMTSQSFEEVSGT